MYELKSLSSVVELKVAGSDKTMRFDFSDHRLKASVLRVIKLLSNLDKDKEERMTEIEKIEDKLDRLIAESDLEVELLVNLHKAVNNAFDCDIVEQLFGVDENAAVPVQKYIVLFDAIIPYISKAMQQERKELTKLNEKYSISGDVDKIVEKLEI